MEWSAPFSRGPRFYIGDRSRETGPPSYPGGSVTYDDGVKWVKLVLLFAALCVLTCVYVDHRVTRAELYMTNLVVDAATGFQSYRKHVERALREGREP